MVTSSPCRQTQVLLFYLRGRQGRDSGGGRRGHGAGHAQEDQEGQEPQGHGRLCVRDSQERHEGQEEGGGSLGRLLLQPSPLVDGLPGRHPGAVRKVRYAFLPPFTFVFA